MKPVPRSSPLSRLRLRRRHPRLAFGLNGLLFFLSAYQAAEGHSPAWSVALYGALGVAQGIALARTGRASLPDALAHVLAAVGLFAASVLLLGHHWALPLLYAFAGGVNVWRAARLRRAAREAPIPIA